MRLVGILWYIFTVLTLENTPNFSPYKMINMLFYKVKSNLNYHMGLFSFFFFFFSKIVFDSDLLTSLSEFAPWRLFLT